MKRRHGLSLAEELDCKIGLDNRTKGLEEAAKTTDSEKAKLGAGVSEACTDRLSNFAAEPSDGSKY